MATDVECLRSAWRALADNQPREGWCTIPLEVGGPCRVLVGRRFPGGEEAVLAGFRPSASVAGHALPSGRGFLVERPVVHSMGDARHWVALSRQPSGNLDLFDTMAADVLALLRASPATGDDRLFQLFIGRVLAWQDFMEKGRDGVLNGQTEVGLFGELVVLGGLLDAGLLARAVMDCWQGPFGALQDFLIGSGAIEVKATVATAGFPATIGSLEQLDDSLRQPLFLAGVRLAVDGAGRSLPDLVAETRTHLSGDVGAATVFDSALLRVGYFDAFADRYLRRFLVAETRVMVVGPQFPRLIAATVPSAIRKARYEIDLDRVTADTSDLRGALTGLGGI